VLLGAHRQDGSMPAAIVDGLDTAFTSAGMAALWSLSRRDCEYRESPNEVLSSASVAPGDRPNIYLTH
jgi:hypothetical protein